MSELTEAHLKAIATLPPDLQGPVRELASDHQLSPVNTRRLAALLSAQPNLSLPVALAMVQAVARSQVGMALERIEQALDELPEAGDFTGSERKVVLACLELLERRIAALRQALLSL